MYYDYYLLVMRVYDKNYGNTEFLSLYQNLNTFQTPVQGVKLFFCQKQKYFLNQCISVHIFWGILYWNTRTELLNNDLLGVLCPGNLLPRPRNLLRANYLDM